MPITKIALEAGGVRDMRQTEEESKACSVHGWKDLYPSLRPKQLGP